MAGWEAWEGSGYVLVSRGLASPLNACGELAVQQLSWMLQTQLGATGPGCVGRVTCTLLLPKNPTVRGLLQTLVSVPHLTKMAVSATLN